MSAFETMGFLYTIFATVAFTVLLFWQAFRGYKHFRESAERGQAEQNRDLATAWKVRNSVDEVAL